jgi:hypothetical protein
LHSIAAVNPAERLVTIDNPTATPGFVAPVA